MSTNSDGVFTRKDRPGYWFSWTDAQGKRRYRKSHAKTLAHARAMRAAEMLKVEQAKTLGFCPPGEDSFGEVAKRFLQHQKARLTDRADVREEGILRDHLGPLYPERVADMRRIDIQRYIPSRIEKTSAHS